ncbi:hypothetical protein BDQ17DRAFT_1245947, partial [Cyathus striatus]
VESQGVLSKNNWMGIQELLNPLQEDGVGEGIADNEEKALEEIAESVHERLDVQKALEINGGDDIEGEDVVAPKPTHKEALTASMLLQQYMADNEDPEARLLEAAVMHCWRKMQLDAFRVLKEPQITDYFKH